MSNKKGKDNSNYKHGMYGTPTYISWADAIERCHNPNDADYVRYGACGITVCQEWRNDFTQFLSDMGEKPEGMELDRINNSLGYFKENCRWVTHRENCRNKSNNRLITLNGETHCLAKWTDVLELPYHAIYERIKDGWSPEKAFSTPVKKYLKQAA